MKIAIVTSKINSVGGVEIFDRDISKILTDRGHNVNIIGRESLLEEPKDNVERKVGEYFNELNKRNHYDVVLCNGEFGYTVDHPKTINVFHGNYYGYAKALEDLVPKELTQDRLKRADMQKISAEGKYVVTVSNYSKKWLERFGIHVDQVIKNSVDPKIFYSTKSKIENHSLALARGRYYEKGFDVLKRLADKGIEIKLFSDQHIDSPNVQNMGLEENENLRKEYNESQLLLFPSRFEGGSLTVLEAMACGCPVLTTPTGYGHDIKDQVNNFVAENFGEFFAKSVLISNERERYGREALDYFWEFHNPEKFKKEWVDLIEEI